MDETTWFTAEKAVEWGLADYVDEAVAAAACITADKATLATRPEGVALNNVTGYTETATEQVDGISITASTDLDVESEGQEPEVAQERAVVVDGCIYRLSPETTD